MLRYTNQEHPQFRSLKAADYFRPLTVDVSVEYELPKEVAPPPGSAPLLIIHPSAFYPKRPSTKISSSSSPSSILSPNKTAPSNPYYLRSSTNTNNNNGLVSSHGSSANPAGNSYRSSRYGASANSSSLSSLGVPKGRSNVVSSATSPPPTRSYELVPSCPYLGQCYTCAKVGTSWRYAKKEDHLPMVAVYHNVPIQSRRQSNSKSLASSSTDATSNMMDCTTTVTNNNGASNKRLRMMNQQQQHQHQQQQLQPQHPHQQAPAFGTAPEPLNLAVGYTVAMQQQQQRLASSSKYNGARGTYPGLTANEMPPALTNLSYSGSGSGPFKSLGSGGNGPTAVSRLLKDGPIPVDKGSGSDSGVCSENESDVSPPMALYHQRFTRRSMHNQELPSAGCYCCCCPPTSDTNSSAGSRAKSLGGKLRGSELGNMLISPMNRSGGSPMAMDSFPAALRKWIVPKEPAVTAAPRWFQV